MNEQILKPNQIKDLRTSGNILSGALSEVASYVKPGISTMSLDEVAERSLRKQGALPSFKNYNVKGSGRFLSSLCVSINNELVHGIPKEDRVLKNGDIVSLDLGANYQGVFSDMALTIGVGKITDNDKKLIEVTKNALDRAIKFVVAGKTTGDLGNYIETYVKGAGYKVIRDLVGHGIGLSPHTDPQIPNFGEKGKGATLMEDMAIAIEPMVTTLDHHIKTARDGWTIMMQKGQKCAHFEHTVLITKNGTEIVTK